MIRAFIVAIGLSVLFASTAAAQDQSPGIQATGTGAASAPAQSAQMQILLGSSAAFGMGPMEMAPGTPNVDQGSEGPMGPMSLSEDQLAPVIDVITGAGLAQDAIEVTLPAINSPFGLGGPETAEIRFIFQQPQEGALADLVAGISAAAPESGLTVLYVGARYRAADCAALTQQAREGAIADANQRAEGLAQGLGVKLGELVQASEFPYFGPTGAGSCAPAGTEGDYGPYGPGTAPAFDPNAIQATVAVQVTLTYAIETAA